MKVEFMRRTPRVAAFAAAVVSAGLIAGPIAALAPSQARAETPGWFTCSDSSAFQLRRDAEADALNAREHQPSAGTVTSADLAAHARWSAMSYAMYEAYADGGDPLDALDRDLRPIALIYGETRAGNHA